MALLLLAGVPAEGRCQDSTHRSSRQLHWQDGARAAGLVGAAVLMDHGMKEWFQNHRSPGSNDVAAVFKHGGQPEVFLTVSVALATAGVVSGEHGLLRAGGRAFTALTLAGLTTKLGKKLTGRMRPDFTWDIDRFDSFSDQDAFPSGHTAMAFALATSLADDLRRPWAAALLYTAAAGTGWSRMNDNKHWLSDVVAGALVGITSAKLVDDRWRVFGIRSPRFLVGPGGRAGIGWSATF